MILLYNVVSTIELTLPSAPILVDGLAEFICAVTGVVEVYDFTWLHNGRHVVERNRPYTTITYYGNISILSIYEISFEEAGNYTCIAYTSVTTLSAPLQDSILLHLQGSYSENNYSYVHSYLANHIRYVCLCEHHFCGCMTNNYCRDYIQYVAIII